MNYCIGFNYVENVNMFVECLIVYSKSESLLSRQSYIKITGTSTRVTNAPEQRQQREQLNNQQVGNPRKAARRVIHHCLRHELCNVQ